MPKYNVEFKDGTVVTVDAPEGANQAQIGMLAFQQLQDMQPPEQPSVPYETPVSAPPPAATMPPPRAKSTEEEEGILLDIAKNAGLGALQFGIGIPRGVIGLGEGVGVGLATLLPEEQELALRDYLQKGAESARQAITPEFYDPEDISSKVGEVVGGTLPFFPAGAAGAAAGRAIAARLGASKLAGTAAGGAAGAATLGAPAGTAEAVERARAAGVPEDEMTGIAAAGAVTGLFEGALPLAMGRLSRLATDPKIRAALDKLSTQELDSVLRNLDVFAANAAKSFGIEGSQEFVTAALQNVIAQSYDPEQDVIDMGALEEAALGGTAGAIISATADMFLPGRRRARPAPYDPKDLEETITGSALYDAETGDTRMTTPEIGEQLRKLGLEPELGRALNFEEIYALEKAGLAADAVQELEDRSLTEAEQADVLKQLEEAGIDIGEPIAPAPFTPTAETVAEPTAEETEAQAQAAEDTVEAATILAEEADTETEAETVAPVAEEGQITPEEGKPEGAPSELVTTVSEPDVEPGADAEGAEPPADRAGPADGGPEPVVGRGDGVSDAGVEPEGGTAVAAAPEPGAVEGAGVPVTEPVDGDGEQPGALDAEPAPTLTPATTEAPAAETEVGVEAEAPAPVRTPQTDAEQVTQLQQADAESLSPSQAGVVTYVPAGKVLDTATIETIAYDAVEQAASAPEGGMSAVAAVQWIRQNGSPEANAQLTKGLQRAQKLIRGELTAPQGAVTNRLVKALVDPNFNPKTVTSRVNKVRELKNLPKALKSPLPNSVKQALRANNLSEAIRLLADPQQVVTQRVTKAGSRTVIESSVPDTYRALAAPMLDYVGDVQVEIVQGLTDDGGNPIAGAYDAANNRILLDSRRGLNAHTVLHELHHALIDKALQEDKLPAVKRLRKIFEEIKPRLGDFYAGTSLSEFIAEFRSNPTLRLEVASLTSDARVHPFRRMLNELANIVRAVIRQPTKTEAELLTPVDKMIFSIMDPAAASVEATEAMLGGDTKKQEAQVDRVLKSYFDSAKTLTEEESKLLNASFVQKFSNAKVGVISDALSFATSFQLSDIFGYFGPRLGKLGRDLNNTLEAQNGGMRNSMLKVDGQYRRIMEWRKNNEKKTRPFDQVVMIATTTQVDPTKPRNTYDGDADKLFAYDRMRPLWERLGADGQEQWKRLRKHYQDMFTELKDVLFSNIDRYVEDSNTAKSLKTQVFQELFGKAELEVYFPLARQGDYWLTYNINGERVVEAFNTEAERRAAIAEIRVAGGSMVTAHGAPTASNIASNAPPGSFVDRTLEILKAGNVNQNVQDQIVELFVNALPETSLIRSMQKRKNRMGAIEDASVAFRQKGYSLARETMRIKYGNELRAIQTQIETEIDSRKALSSARVRYAEAEERQRLDPNKRNENARNRAKKKLEEMVRRYGDKEMSTSMASALKSEAGLRVSFATNPPSGIGMFFAKVANRLGFIWFMGFNPSSAIVQSGQIPLVNYWATAGRTDNKTAGRAYATATTFFGSSGFRRQEAVYDSEGKQVGTEMRTGTNPSIDNYYIADDQGRLRIRDDLPGDRMDKPHGKFAMPDGTEKELTYKEFLEYMLPMVQLASDRGKLGHSALLEQLEVNSVWANTTSVMDAVTGVAGVMFHNAETFGLQVTLTANYINEMHRLNTRPTAEERGMNPEEKQAYAANEAIYLTQQTNGGSALVTTSRVAQGKGRLGAFGRTMMMFKTYGLGMWYHQIKSARQALNSIEDPAVKRQAKIQIFGMTMTSIALTGVQGFALTGVATALFDMLFFDEEEDMPAEVMLEDWFADSFVGQAGWTGAINYATKLMGGELDLSQRMGFSHLIINNSRYVERERDLYGIIGAALLGVSGSLFNNWYNAFDALKNGDFRTARELGLPVAFANLSRFLRYADEGDITLRTNAPIMDDYTNVELFGKAMGVSSSRRSRKQRRLGLIKTQQETLIARAAKLRQDRNARQAAGDHEEVMRIDREIVEFNRRFPAYRIATPSKTRSRDQFRAAKEKTVGGIRFQNEEALRAAREIEEEESLKRQQTSE